MWAQTVCLADERNLPDFGAKQKLTLSHILVAKLPETSVPIIFWTLPRKSYGTLSSSFQWTMMFCVHVYPQPCSRFLPGVWHPLQRHQTLLGSFEVVRSYLYASLLFVRKYNAKSEHGFHLQFNFISFCVFIIMLVYCHRAVSCHLSNHSCKFPAVNHFRDKRAPSGVPCDIFSDTEHLARFGQSPGYKFRDLLYSCLPL